MKPRSFPGLDVMQLHTKGDEYYLSTEASRTLRQLPSSALQKRQGVSKGDCT